MSGHVKSPEKPRRKSIAKEISAKQDQLKKIKEDIAAVDKKLEALEIENKKLEMEHNFSELEIVGVQIDSKADNERFINAKDENERLKARLNLWKKEENEINSLMQKYTEITNNQTPISDEIMQKETQNLILLEKVKTLDELKQPPYDTARKEADKFEEFLQKRKDERDAIENQLNQLVHKIDGDYQNKDNEISLSLIGDKDGDRLTELLSSIVAAKEDSQQRNWALYEDETVIISQIEEIHNLLNDGNPLAVKTIIKSNEYAYLHHLILYYQMEPRFPIRLSLLKCFTVLCTWGHDHGIISELITSGFFCELVRDLLSVKDCKFLDEIYFLHLIRILVYIFSSGEAIPISYYNDLNSVFINFVLDWIKAEKNDFGLFIKLILAYNLQFQQLSTNLVMQELANRMSDTVLTQSLLNYLNRDEDPIREFNSDKKAGKRNSVIKFITDIFSSLRTGNYFYTNDFHVLIDILIRQLDRYNKDTLEYLNMVQLIMENSDYLEEGYKIKDLKKILLQINIFKNVTPDVEIVLDKLLASIKI